MIKINVIGAYPVEVEWNAIALPFTVGEETGQIFLFPFSNEERDYVDIVVMVRFRERLLLTKLLRGFEGELPELIKELDKDPFQILPELHLALKAQLTTARNQN